MKRNFYLQHSLMAMNDPRMKHLLEVEGLRGLGAYWMIQEKLALLPEPRAQFGYLRPYCHSKKSPFAYLKKIIMEFQLFEIDEDGYFIPLELNPVKKKEKKSAKNIRESSDSNAKNVEKWQKTSKNNLKNQAKNPDKSLINSTISETSTSSFKENIKDIITATAKEKETAAATAEDLPSPVRNDPPTVCNDSPTVCNNSPVACNNSLTVCDDSGRPQPPLHPVRPWQELVDSLTEESSWLELACMQSGYGGLLMRHIKAAVDLFKQHIEVYDKWHDLLTNSDVRRYFVNYVKAGQHTSQTLYATLLTLDAKQRSVAPPDPYRYEQHINGKRTYLGCPIPDNAPPRPDGTAFWNETTHAWSSQGHT